MDSLPFAAKDAAMRHILYRGLGFEWNVETTFSWLPGVRDLAPFVISNPLMISNLGAANMR